MKPSSQAFLGKGFMRWWHIIFGNIVMTLLIVYDTFLNCTRIPISINNLIVNLGSDSVNGTRCRVLGRSLLTAFVTCAFSPWPLSTVAHIVLRVVLLSSQWPRLPRIFIQQAEISYSR